MSAQGVTTVSAPRTMTVRKVAVVAAKFSRSEATVYPAKDRYVVTMSVAGPEGSKITKRASITVKEGKLVTKTHRSSRSSASTLQRVAAFDVNNDGYCEETRSGELGCIGYDAYSDENGTVSLIAFGKISIPSKVASAQKYGRVKVRMHMNTRTLYGSGAWGYGPADDPTARLVTLRKGTTTAGWATLPKGSKQVGVSVGLGTYSFFYASTTKVEYQYKVMVR